jgi:hypothetical protein
MLTVHSQNMQAPYLNQNLSFYDFAAPTNTPFPREYFIGFLNQPWVQKALGVPVNFTESNVAVNEAFQSVGDLVRSPVMGDIAYLLDSGVKVAMVYGDRDFACNWIGGENVSLHIPWSHQADFSRAGYTPLQVNASYVGGQTRQFGNLSFTRVYQSGHEVPSYQPEAAFQIFNRAMTGKDIATGNTVVTDGFSTTGPGSTWDIIKQSAPAIPPEECYVLASQTCDTDTWNSVVDGTAKVYEWIVGNSPAKAGSGGSPKKAGASSLETPLLGLLAVAVVALLGAI